MPRSLMGAPACTAGFVAVGKQLSRPLCSLSSQPTPGKVRFSMAASLVASKEALQNQDFFFQGALDTQARRKPTGLVICLPMHHHSARELLLTGMAQRRASPSHRGACMEPVRSRMDGRSLMPSCDGHKASFAHQDKQMMWLGRHPARRGFRESAEGVFFPVAALLDQNCAPTLLGSKGS